MTRRHSLALTVAALLAGAAGAAYATEVAAPLPMPTAEQLKKGQELLNALLRIAANVRLTDSVAVMNELGVDEIYLRSYPDHFLVSPKYPMGSELRSRGFENISMTQMRGSEQNSIAHLNMRLIPEIACLNIDDVERNFGAARKETWLRQFGHPPPQRVKAQPNDGLSYEPIATPVGPIGVFSFEFSYQVCAVAVSFNYRGGVQPIQQLQQR